MSELDDKIKASIEWFNSLTPEQQAEHRLEQAKSWARAFEPCEHGILDWEDCPDCRRAALSQ